MGELRAWVTWLHDRYELSVEDRLPRCWASHPGLIEELSALKAWREEIYASSQPSGQAARYWHAELRQVTARRHHHVRARLPHRPPRPRPYAAADPDLLAALGRRRPAGRRPRHRPRRRPAAAGDLARAASGSPRRSTAAARCRCPAARPPLIRRCLVGARLRRLGKGPRPERARPSLRSGGAPGTPACQMAQP